MTEEQKPLEVLVVDDEEPIRVLLVDVIGSDEVNVNEAEDGLDAIQKYDERLPTETPYDVVFTDLRMPGKTGVDVVRHVKETSPQTLVYVITGDEPNREYEKLKEQLGQLKPDGVIKKPFDIDAIDTLIGQIKSYINSGYEGDPPQYQPPNPQS